MVAGNYLAPGDTKTWHSMMDRLRRRPMKLTDEQIADIFLAGFRTVPKMHDMTNYDPYEARRLGLKAVAEFAWNEAIKWVVEKIGEDFFEPVINLYIHDENTKRIVTELWQSVKQSLEVKDGC